MSGSGSPEALHMSVTVSPSVVVTSEVEKLWLIFAGTENMGPLGNESTTI